MDPKFSLSPSVILRSEPQYYNTYVAFDYKRVSTAFLTEEEYRVLEFISSKPADLEETSDKTRVRRGECERFLKRMRDLGYVQLGSVLMGGSAHERIRVDLRKYEKHPVPFLSAPSSVDIFITSRCNLNCVHCFASKGEDVVRELTLDELKSVFDQLENMLVFEVRINGGEPFLHPEIEKILQILKNKSFRTVILTNGTLVNENNARLLKESSVIPTVSLDDSDADGHDAFRGVKGAFEHTLRGLKTLNETKIMYGINCCLHRKNMHKYGEIVRLAADCGAYRIAFLDLKMSARLKKNMEWVPSRKEYREAMPYLNVVKYKCRERIDVSLDVFLHCQPAREAVSEARRGYISCHAGTSRLSIDSDGSVYPCNMVLSDPKWRIGSIREHRLQDIWFSNRWKFFRGGVKTSDLRNCRSCRRARKCKDIYCRLYPYITSGDPYGSHPGCS